MINIPDDPIISCIERTGYPPWYFRSREYDGIIDKEWEEDDDFEDDSDVFYGNQTESF